tara:strand:- start:43 stop:477 length:435 start_codon:yes stop_codon:yes gene_type:complete
MKNPLYGQNSYDDNVGSVINPGEPSIAIGTSTQTLTIAELLSQVIEEDPEGAAAWTLPTPALSVAGIPGVQVGDCIDFFIVNNATSTADEPITVTMPSGGTAVGNMLVEAAMVSGEVNSGSGHFRIRFTNVTSSSETYSCYRLA